MSTTGLALLKAKRQYIKGAAGAQFDVLYKMAKVFHTMSDTRKDNTAKDYSTHILYNLGVISDTMTPERIELEKEKFFRDTTKHDSYEKFKNSLLEKQFNKFNTNENAKLPESMAVIINKERNFIKQRGKELDEMEFDLLGYNTEIEDLKKLISKPPEKGIIKKDLLQDLLQERKNALKGLEEGKKKLEADIKIKKEEQAISEKALGEMCVEAAILDFDIKFEDIRTRFQEKLYKPATNPDILKQYDVQTIGLLNCLNRAFSVVESQLKKRMMVSGASDIESAKDESAWKPRFLTWAASVNDKVIKEIQKNIVPEIKYLSEFDIIMATPSEQVANLKEGEIPRQTIMNKVSSAFSAFVTAASSYINTRSLPEKQKVSATLESVRNTIEIERMQLANEAFDIFGDFKNLLILVKSIKNESLKKVIDSLSSLSLEALQLKTEFEQGVPEISKRGFITRQQNCLKKIFEEVKKLTDIPIERNTSLKGSALEDATIEANNLVLLKSIARAGILKIKSLDFELAVGQVSLRHLHAEQLKGGDLMSIVEKFALNKIDELSESLPVQMQSLKIFQTRVEQDLNKYGQMFGNIAHDLETQLEHKKEQESSLRQMSNDQIQTKLLKFSPTAANKQTTQPESPIVKPTSHRPR